MKALILLTAILTATLNAYAYQETINGEVYEVSDEYSDKDFTGRSLTSEPDMSGLVIVNTCFSHEQPDSVVFPQGTTGIHFFNCNLDNVVIPPNSVTTNCSTRRFKAQEDGLDWEIDSQNHPIKVLGT